MRKAIKIATISLLAWLLIGCNESANNGHAVALKAEREAGTLVDPSLGSPGKNLFSYHMGPYNIGAHSPAAEMIENPQFITFRVEESIWMTSFEPRVEDAEGNPLPGELVYQIIVVNRAEESSLCVAKQTGNPFAAATSTMEKIELPEDHAYPILSTDTIEARVVLKNPTDQDINGIYVAFTIGGEKIDGTKSFNDVMPIMLDIDPCEHLPVSVPPGQFVEKISTVYSPKKGAIIKAYGLLQDYGVYVSVKKGDDDPFWNGTAEIDESYKIVGLSPFEDPAGIAINKGEALELTVAYDNASDSWYDDASGAAIVYLALDNAGESTQKAIRAVSANKTILR